MPQSDYQHGFYNSTTLFEIAEVFGVRILKIALESKLTSIIFVSASSSGSAITTAVMSCIHKKIPCEHVYVKRDKWSFRFDGADNVGDYISMKNDRALSTFKYQLSYAEVRKGKIIPEHNIFILDDLIDSGVTIDVIYKKLESVDKSYRINRIIVQLMYGSSKSYDWDKLVEYYQLDDK